MPTAEPQSGKPVLIWQATAALNPSSHTYVDSYPVMISELGGQLHRIFKRLERERIALDYNKLAWNLRNWGKKADEVKTRWAMDFWKAPAELLNIQDA